MDLGNCPKRESLQKWLGRVQKVFLTLLGPGSKGLPRLFCTTQTLFCTGATPFRTSARGLLLAGSKRSFAPSPNHFRELSLSGNFPDPQLPKACLNRSQNQLQLQGQAPTSIKITFPVNGPLSLCMPFGVRQSVELCCQVKCRRGSVLDFECLLHDEWSSPQAIWAKTSNQGSVGARPLNSRDRVAS